MGLAIGAVALVAGPVGCGGSADRPTTPEVVQLPTVTAPAAIPNPADHPGGGTKKSSSGQKPPEGPAGATASTAAPATPVAQDVGEQHHQAVANKGHKPAGPDTGGPHRNTSAGGGRTTPEGQ
jgi:hypothetical protein